MRHLDNDKITRAALRLKGLFAPRAAILLYHRVIDTPSDPYMLQVKPRYFAEHLQVIREIAQPMRLQQLADGVRTGKIPKRAVCITFDDGYEDNLFNAKPLLERYDIPATVFMTTGSIGREREFWWDELERVFLQPGQLPQRLEMHVDGKTYEWEFDAYAEYQATDIRRYETWTMAEIDDCPTPRHRALCELHELIRPMREAQRQHILAQLLEWAGLASTVRSTNRAIPLNEVSALEDGGLIDVGCHTINHPALSTLPADIQRKEVTQSKAQLEKSLGHPVKSFAYPYGDYSTTSVQTVREAGFEYACACNSRGVGRDSEGLLLPRVHIGNWAGDRFARHLTRELRI